MDDRFLVISDIDGTLLGDDEALLQLVEWLEAQGDRFRLVLNSGRLTDSIREAVELTNLPDPEAIIGGVGTQMEDFASAEPFDGWPQVNGSWDANAVRQIMGTLRNVELQPERYLNDHKVSFFAYDATPELLNTWHGLLQAEGQGTHFIYSSDRDLDVLPAGVDKGTAAAFLAHAWGYSAEQVIVSGDSGNDAAMFRQGFHGIIVGNALPELRELAGGNIYQADAECAGGVLEGLLRLAS